MLVSEVKPIGKFGKNMLENENPEELIKSIIEKPLQKACIECKNKNIETIMSSANKNNIVSDAKKRIDKKDLEKMLEKNNLLDFSYVGRGYAWIMINYNTLSDENREILFSIEENLGEDSIWFVKENYTDFMNSLRRKLRIKEIKQTFNDKYADKFKEKQLKLVYKKVYPTRNVFIRMPINKNTTLEDVELYFGEIISKLNKQ